ncbi:MAG: DMT family transporter [Oscillospiraceae bacterium]|jgi:drug/metabolite transporter (DMT)-like permease|nr:DMT family transporter [Oscillospiraceae bacterium]
MSRIVANLLLVLTAFIWGTAFVAQSVGMDHLEPFTFNSVRNFIGALALLPVIAAMRRGKPKPSREERRATWLGGLCCGLVLFAASNFQQFGIVYTTAGKAGFITALYIVLVPVCGFLLGKRVKLQIWAAVALAAAGLYLLCIQEDFSIGLGDLLVLVCAFLYTLHILVIDYFSRVADCVKMSCIQFLVGGVLAGICMLIFETPRVPNITAAWLPILYTGLLSSGVAYTLQIVTQKHTDPTVASLLMSLESVFAVLAGWLVLGESFTAREMGGVVLMFGAIVLAQVRIGRRRTIEG